MNKYIITYISKGDDDVCKVWVHANSKDEAKREALSEYWDIKEIISIVKK